MSCSAMYCSSRTLKGGVQYPELSKVSTSSTIGYTMEELPVVSIDSLKPGFVTDASIRVRVIGKTDSFRPFYEGDGTYFNLGLCDDSGEIKAIAFDEPSFILYKTLEVNRMYYISNFEVVDANKKYNFMKNDLEIKMVYGKTQVTEQIPSIKYNFVEIEEIYSGEFTHLDVIGVCVDISEVEDKLKAGRMVPHRDITLVDQTRAEIKVVLWQNHADQFSGNEGDILAIKGAEVYEFQDNILLRCPIGVILNPDVPEADTLRAWYNNDTKPEELMVQD